MDMTGLGFANFFCQLLDAIAVSLYSVLSALVVLHRGARALEQSYCHRLRVNFHHIQSCTISSLMMVVWKCMSLAAHNDRSADAFRAASGLKGNVRLGKVRLDMLWFVQVRLGQVRLGQAKLGQVRLVHFRFMSSNFATGAQVRVHARQNLTT